MFGTQATSKAIFNWKEFLPFMFSVYSIFIHTYICSCLCKCSCFFLRWKKEKKYIKKIQERNLRFAKSIRCFIVLPFLLGGLFSFHCRMFQTIFPIFFAKAIKSSYRSHYTPRLKSYPIEFKIRCESVALAARQRVQYFYSSAIIIIINFHFICWF